MTFTAKQLQEEQKPWIEHNFGPGMPHQPLLGMIEELGELVQHIKVWNVAEIKDSLADFVVFSADYCTKRGWDLERIMTGGLEVSPTRDLEATVLEAYVTMSKVAHHQLKTEQNIRGSSDEHAEKAKSKLYWALLRMESIAKHFGWTLMDDCVAPVWARVKLRDFKKNQRTGGDSAPVLEG